MIFINRKLCDLCGTCVGVCPVNAIIIEGDEIMVDHKICTQCGACISVCPAGAIEEKE